MIAKMTSPECMISPPAPALTGTAQQYQWSSLTLVPVSLSLVTYKLEESFLYTSYADVSCMLFAA